MLTSKQDIIGTVALTTAYEPDRELLTQALAEALESEDPGTLRDALEWWASIAHSPWIFAIGAVNLAGRLAKKLTVGSKTSWERVLSRVRSYGSGLEGEAKAMRCEPALFAIAYLTARMWGGLIDPSEVGRILHESGWVN